MLRLQLPRFRLRLLHKKADEPRGDPELLSDVLVVAEWHLRMGNDCLDLLDAEVLPVPLLEIVGPHLIVDVQLPELLL